MGYWIIVQDRYRILYSKATGRYQIGTEGCRMMNRMGTGYCTARLQAGTG
jgi:hypothetical protein